MERLAPGCLDAILSTRMPTIDLHWADDLRSPSLTGDQSEHLLRTMQSWLGTPYRLFSQTPGRSGGTDCVRYIGALGDALQGTQTEIPRVLSDVSFHCPETAKSGMRFLMRAFSMRVVPETDWHGLQESDVIISGPPGGGPGHAMMAAKDKFIYHCNLGSGVSRCGLDLHGYEFFAVLRRIGAWS